MGEAGISAQRDSVARRRRVDRSANTSQTTVPPLQRSGNVSRQTFGPPTQHHDAAVRINSPHAVTLDEGRRPAVGYSRWWRADDQESTDGQNGDRRAQDAVWRTETPGDDGLDLDVEAAWK